MLTLVGAKSHIIMLLQEFAGVCIFAMELMIQTIVPSQHKQISLEP